MHTMAIPMRTSAIVVALAERLPALAARKTVPSGGSCASCHWPAAPSSTFKLHAPARRRSHAMERFAESAQDDGPRARVCCSSVLPQCGTWTARHAFRRRTPTALMLAASAEVPRRNPRSSLPMDRGAIPRIPYQLSSEFSSGSTSRACTYRTRVAHTSTFPGSVPQFPYSLPPWTLADLGEER